MHITNYISPHITFRIPTPHTWTSYFNGWLSAPPSGNLKYDIYKSCFRLYLQVMLSHRLDSIHF